MKSQRARSGWSQGALCVLLAATALYSLHCSSRSQTAPGPAGSHAERHVPIRDGACRTMIDEPTARRLFEGFAALRADDQCRLAGVSTESARMEVRWTRNGEPVEPVFIVPSPCAASVAPPADDLSALPSPGFERACPETARAMLTVLARPPPATTVAAAPTTWGPGVLPTLGCMALALAVSIALSMRALGLIGVRRGTRAMVVPQNPKDIGLAAWSLAGFVLAAVVRLAKVPTLSNWYAEVIPFAGPVGEARFGPGAFAFQSALRAVFPWSDLTLMRADALIGALSVPIFMRVLRERSVALEATLACGLLLALAPLHVLISASPSEHVLASTLTLAVMLAWVRGYPRGDLLYLALALILVPVVSVTRPDAWLILAVVPLWGLWRDRSELRDDERPPRSRRIAWIASYAVIWALAGIAVRIISKRSHHPLPSREQIVQNLPSLVSQYADVGFTPPHWMSPLPVVLALLGLVAMMFSRRALLGCVLLTLAGSFVPLGRNLVAGGIVGARYFLTTIPVFLVLAGYGYAAIGRGIDRMSGKAPPATVVPIDHALRAHPIGHGVGLLVLGVAMFVLSRTAYQHRYTFQDEYTFLRRELKRLPAGCTVYQLPVRSTAFDRDLDCCLDAPRSPLTLAFPRLRFGLIDPARLASVAPQTASERPCEVYYQTAACGLQDTDRMPATHRRAYAILSRQCARMRASGLVPIVEGDVSVPVFDEWFDGHRPRVGLYSFQSVDWR